MSDKLWKAMLNPSDKIFKEALDQYMNEIRLMIEENGDKPLPQLEAGKYWAPIDSLDGLMYK